LGDIGDRAGRLGVEIADVAGLIADLSNVSQSQALQAEAARSSAREMGSATARLNETMSTTREAAADARRVLDHSAGQISDVVTRTSQTMTVLSESALGFRSTLDDVAGTVKGVEKASMAIAQIARETKLLALNASVE